MDLLSQRYASPFLLLDEFIHLEQLHEFVMETLNTISEERKEKYQWQFFLHKVFDKSFSEFLEMANNTQHEDGPYMSEENIKDVVNESSSLLDGFIFE